MRLSGSSSPTNGPGLCPLQHTSRAISSCTLNHGRLGQVEPSIRRRSRDREKGIYMPDLDIPSLHDNQRAEGVREKAEHGRQNAEQDRGFTEDHRTAEESARAEAEQFRRLAEEAREVRNQHLEALESVRQ